jgi:hypothetical protein
MSTHSDGEPIRPRLALEMKPPVFDAFYEDSSKDYWVKDSSGRFMRVTEGSIRRMLKHAGFGTSHRKFEPLSELEEHLRITQVDRRIFYAGPLAGHGAGTYEIEGKLILVIDSPKLIEPVRRPFPTVQGVVSRLLGPEQAPYFYGWLRFALENLRSDERHPAQALVLAGERECGKSLLQQIITELLGGRSAKPYQFMTQATTFNAELFGAEHLIIEDEAASTDLRARRKFGAYLKQITASETQRHHGKNKTALTLRPFWRLTISVNDEPENLMVLPPLDESLQDKLILFRTEKHSMPMRTDTPKAKAMFWRTIQTELPGLVHHALNFKIPETMRSARYGVTHFHHPSILEAIQELAPETVLLEFVDGYFFDTHETEWEGTAGGFENRLRSTMRDLVIDARPLDKLLSFNTAAGTYLGRLATKHPERVSCRRIHGRKLWRIRKRGDDASSETSNEG